MSRQISIKLLLLFALASMLWLFGCSGSTEVEPDKDTPVSGVVYKGPVAGATLQIHVLGGDGNPGDAVGAPIITDATGAWSGVIPAGHAGQHFLVVSSGGTYQDEATGNAVTLLPGHQMIGYFKRSNASSVAVTPFTHLMHLKVRHMLGQYTYTADRAWTLGVGLLAADNSLQFDPTTTIPSLENSATAAQQAHAAWLGGLSELLQDEWALRPFLGAHPFEMVFALMQDLADGGLDGKDLDGDPINVELVPGGGDYAPLPPLDGNGFDPLIYEAWDYVIDTPELRDVELPEDPVIPGFIPDPLEGCDDMPTLRRLARQSLENSLFVNLNGPDPEVPRDVDFSDALYLYESILDCDPDDLDAHFAITLLDLAALAVDPDVNDAFEAWEAYLDELVPFEVDPGTAKLAIPGPIPSSEGAFNIPFTTVRRSMLPYLNLKQLPAPPQVSEAQDIIRNKIIDRVLTGLTHLEEVLLDPDFVFSISPRMQGDLLEETREADNTDFLALWAGLKGLEAGCRVAIAYDVSMDDYTGAHLLASLEQSSTGFLTLTTDGATQMQMVPGLLLEAAQGCDTAIDALFAETDPQHDDLIKIGPSDINRDELTDFQNIELEMITQSLQGPYSHLYDWDFRSYTPDVALTVDLDAFFTEPIQNWKQMIPPYTVRLDTVPYDHEWTSHRDSMMVTVTAPAAETVWASCSWEKWEGSYCNGPEWLTSVLSDIRDTELARIEAIPGWSGYASINVSFYDTVIAGTQQIEIFIRSNYEYYESWIEVATIVFNASNYSDWLDQWPDPTINGLFPDATAVEPTMEAFGWEEDEWSQEFSLDWDGHVGFDYNYPDPPETP